MSFALTKEAAERPRHTIHAAEILHDKAWAVARACAEAREGQVIVALVECDLTFGGVWTIPLEELRERVPRMAPGGWSLTFAPGTRRDEIEQRCLELARLAFRRWEAVRRWASRHAATRP